MNVGDVYVGPRHGRRYRVVAIGPGSGTRPRCHQSATAALMTAANGWSLVRRPETA
jgi:hypothetical protein